MQQETLKLRLLLREKEYLGRLNGWVVMTDPYINKSYKKQMWWCKAGHLFNGPVDKFEFVFQWN